MLFHMVSLLFTLHYSIFILYISSSCIFSSLIPQPLYTHHVSFLLHSLSPRYCLSLSILIIFSFLIPSLLDAASASLYPSSCHFCFILFCTLLPQSLYTHHFLFSSSFLLFCLLPQPLYTHHLLFSSPFPLSWLLPQPFYTDHLFSFSYLLSWLLPQLLCIHHFFISASYSVFSTKTPYFCNEFLFARSSDVAYSSLVIYFFHVHLPWQRSIFRHLHLLFQFYLFLLFTHDKFHILILNFLFGFPLLLAASALYFVQPL